VAAWLGSVSRVAGSEEAAQVLVEADAGLFRDAGWVGIYSLKKIPDLELHLLVAQGDDLTRLDVVAHFRAHCCSSQKNFASASEEAATRTVSHKHVQGK